MTSDEILMRRLYDAFNRRDIAGVLVHLADEVAWANGQDGGHEQGREAVRAYWTRQWAQIAPEVVPLAVTTRADDSLAVEVRQIVRDLRGDLLLDETVRHVFYLRDGLVARFDIENAGGLAALAHD